MQRLVIIYNPSSGRHRVEHALHKLLRLLPSEEYAIDSWNIRHEAISPEHLKGHDYVIVIGGDGTLRTTIQILLDANLNIPIALIPRGSANLLAKSLGLPFLVSEAAHSIQRGTTTTIDVGRLTTGEYFVGAFALGYFSHRIATTDKQLKKMIGFGGYFWSFIREMKLPEHTFTFTVDDRAYTATGHSLFIVNTSNLFGIHSSRVADFRDGIFELAVTTNKTFFSLIGLLMDFYLRRGKPKHFMLVPGSRFSLKTVGSSQPQIDGEILSEMQQIDITVIPRTQRFIIP